MGYLKKAFVIKVKFQIQLSKIEKQLNVLKRTFDELFIYQKKMLMNKILMLLCSLLLGSISFAQTKQQYNSELIRNFAVTHFSKHVINQKLTTLYQLALA